MRNNLVVKYNCINISYILYVFNGNTWKKIRFTCYFFTKNARYALNVGPYNTPFLRYFRPISKANEKNAAMRH